MSLKAIEMQVALPRTQDAGKVQEQLSQRGQQIHDHQAAQVKREQELKRTQVTENQDTQKNKLSKDREDQNKGQQHFQQRSKSKEHASTEDKHPYKGNLLDIEG